MKKNDIVNIAGYDITIGELKEIINKYLVKHSVRRLTNMYMNISNRNKYLIFINVKGDKAVKINNNELVFRIVHIKNKRDNQILFNFLNKYFLDSKITQDFSPLIMLRVDLVLAYLNKLNYDLDLLKVKMNKFFAFQYTNSNDKVVTIGNVERDYLLVFKFYKIFNEYVLSEKKISNKDGMNFYLCENATELLDKINSNGFIEFSIDTIDEDKFNKNYIYLVDALDIVSLKYLNSFKSKDYNIYLILKKIDKVFKFITFVSTPDANIITTRPFISYSYEEKQKELTTND